MENSSFDVRNRDDKLLKISLLPNNTTKMAILCIKFQHAILFILLCVFEKKKGEGSDYTWCDYKEGMTLTKITKKIIE